MRITNLFMSRENKKMSYPDIQTHKIKMSQPVVRTNRGKSSPGSHWRQHSHTGVIEYMGAHWTKLVHRDALGDTQGYFQTQRCSNV